jgi:putative photosynthetic complex assembly protein 2
MLNAFGPALYCLFIWWFATGLIVFLNNLPPRTFGLSFAAGSVVAGISLWRLADGSHDVSVAGAYAAFTYGVLVWGWHEMAFFMGFLTGPRKTACPAGATGWRHFSYGVSACLHHELAILATAVLVVALTRGAPNQVGMWTFMALWGMRQSAKLNMALGVLNLGEVFLPPHLTYLVSFMKRRRMNWLMPLSLAGGTALVMLLAHRIAEPSTTPFERAGLTCITTMLALAVLEHALLVLPVPYTLFWSLWLRLCGRAETEPSLVLPASETALEQAGALRRMQAAQEFHLSPAEPAFSTGATR